MYTEKMKEYQKEYYKKNRERIINRALKNRKDYKENYRESAQKYYQEHKEERKEYSKNYSINNKEKRKEYKQRYIKNHPERVKDGERERKKNKRREIRRIVLEYFGNRCTCCGETEDHFLAIDHINNDGAKHRKELGNKNIYKWLIQNAFPAGFQLLCHNCNMAKAFYGVCPHEEKRILDKLLTDQK